MAINGVVPSRLRLVSANGEFLGFHKPSRYQCSEDFAQSVARGVLPLEYLDCSDRFRGCSETAHVRDVLLLEGFYEEHGDDVDKRRKSARERVKKRRQRAH